MNLSRLKWWFYENYAWIMSIRVGAIPPSAAAIGQSRGRTDTFLYGLILAAYRF